MPGRKIAGWIGDEEPGIRPIAYPFALRLEALSHGLRLETAATSRSYDWCLRLKLMAAVDLAMTPWRKATSSASRL